MALSTPEQVQLFGKSDAPAGSGGFKLTGEAKEGDGFCRVWLRPLEAWDRALNPRMESDRWDARAYRKLDSAFEFVPEFTLKDLEEMAENFEFPQDTDVFASIEFNGDPVHDTVLAWARHVTGSSKTDPSEGFTVREPQGRYKTAKGTESLDYDRDLVFSSSSPAPLGGVAHRGPAAIPASAKKSAPPETAVKPAAKAAAKPAQATESTGDAKSAASVPKSEAEDTGRSGGAKPNPAPSQTDDSTSSAEAAPTPANPPTPPPAAEKATEGASAPPSPPPAPAKKSGSAKTTQAMSMLDDEDLGDDKLSALRERLAQSRAKKNEE